MANESIFYYLHFMATFYIESEWPLHFIGATSTFPPAYTSYSFGIIWEGGPLVSFCEGDPIYFCWGGTSFLLIDYLIDNGIMFWEGDPGFLYIITGLSFLCEGGTYILYFFLFILFKKNKEWFSFQCVCNAFNIKLQLNWYWLI